MSEIIKTSHAVLISEDFSTTLVESNLRFWWKFTLFWWKLNEGENPIDWLKRELLEETWIVFSDDDIKILVENDELILWEKIFIWFIYYIILSKSKIKKILIHSDRNTEIETSIPSLWKVEFAFDKVREQINRCLDLLNNNKLNN